MDKFVFSSALIVLIVALLPSSGWSKDVVTELPDAKTEAGSTDVAGCVECNKREKRGLWTQQSPQETSQEASALFGKKGSAPTGESETSH